MTIIIPFAEKFTPTLKALQTLRDGDIAVLKKRTRSACEPFIPALIGVSRTKAYILIAKPFATWIQRKA